MKKLLLLLSLILLASCVNNKKEHVSIPIDKWDVVFPHSKNKNTVFKLHEKLFFAVNENGENDLLFIAVRSGGIYPTPIILNNKGIEIELSKIEDDQKKVIWSGSLKTHLLYEGIIIKLGDAFNEKGQEIKVTKLRAVLK